MWLSWSCGPVSVMHVVHQPFGPKHLGSNATVSTGFNRVVTVDKLLTYSCIALRIHSSVYKLELYHQTIPDEWSTFHSLKELIMHLPSTSILPLPTRSLSRLRHPWPLHLTSSFYLVRHIRTTPPMVYLLPIIPHISCFHPASSLSFWTSHFWSATTLRSGLYPF